MQREGSGGEQDLKRAVTMNLHGKSLASTVALEECPNLRSLDLSFNLLAKIEG
jgi:Leucine-rich repeat (LRR) protein